MRLKRFFCDRSLVRQCHVASQMGTTPSALLGEARIVDGHGELEVRDFELDPALLVIADQADLVSHLRYVGDFGYGLLISSRPREHI